MLPDWQRQQVAHVDGEVQHCLKASASTKSYAMKLHSNSAGNCSESVLRKLTCKANWQSIRHVHGPAMSPLSGRLQKGCIQCIKTFPLPPQHSMPGKAHEAVFSWVWQDVSHTHNAPAPEIPSGSSVPPTPHPSPPHPKKACSYLGVAVGDTQVSVLKWPLAPRPFGEAGQGSRLCVHLQQGHGQAVGHAPISPVSRNILSF